MDDKEKGIEKTGRFMVDTFTVSTFENVTGTQAAVLECLLRLSAGTDPNSKKFILSIQRAAEGLKKSKKAIEFMRNRINEKIETAPTVMSLNVIRKAKE